MTRTSIQDRREALHMETWAPMTLHERLSVCAQTWPDRPYVITDERVLTYAETWQWVQRLADGLAALGVRPGDHVGLLLANFTEFVPLKFAISLAGAVAVPFNYLYREDELAYVLRQSQVTVLVAMTGFAGLDHLGMIERVGGGLTLVLLSTDGRTRDGVLDVEGLAELGDAHPGAGRAGASPGDVADILYTSGTTGSPKGVMVTHDAVQRTAYASALTRAFEDGRRVLFSLPCYHMFGYVEGLLSVLFVGGAVVPQTAFDPVGYLDGIQRHQATDVLCVPTMAVAIAQHPDRHEYDLTSWTAVLCGSAPAPVWIWETFRAEFGVEEIVTGYGMTECGGAMTLTLPEDDLAMTSTTVGRPKLAGAAGIDGGVLMKYRTVDPVSGQPLPAGSDGELVSTGPTVMHGFWDKPEETSAVLREGWLHSGDLGVVGADGYLRLTGRSKELYKSGGELVMPKEIEELLSGHPDVSQVYAIGLADERWGEIGCAVVVRRPGAALTEEDVLALCRDRLARFKVPKRVVFLDAAELPTTPTGKVQKFKLAALVSGS